MSPSVWQLAIVVLIILLLFGRERLPGLGKALGESISSFRKGLIGGGETPKPPKSSEHS